MAAEAACGFKCVILESWRYNENLGTNQYAGRFTNTGHTYDPIAKEVLVVPQTSGETLDNSRRRSIYLALAKIKPANTVITVDELGLAVRTVINIRHAVSASEYFEIRRYVTGVNLPDPPLADRYFWAEDGVEQEAPTFAHLQTMEAQWQQNKAISSIETVVIDPDTLAESTLSPRIDPVEREWGDWRAVELADSPDNYPDGKFSGDPSKRAPNGDYMYAWTSQDEYVDWLTEQIEAIGGEILEDRYRLPVEAEPVPTVASSPSDSLAADAISISTTYYTL